MFLYLLFVLFAYYILKPVAQAMFLEKYDPDDLPFLIILIAVGAGIFAYLYGRVAVKVSLTYAVNWTMAVATTCLVAIWWVLGFKLAWMLYVFNIFVGVFSITLVTQGWVVAGNVFNAREAKRVYPLLALALVIGAVMGGESTRRLVKVVSHPQDLVLGAAIMVVLAYAAFLLAKAQKGVDLSRARAVESEETSFSVKELTRDIARTRHLQIIIAVMAMIFMVDVLVNYQFQAMAKITFTHNGVTNVKALAAFFGSFYGVWVAVTEFVVQLLITSAVVSRLGVGGSLQIMPVSILLASVATAIAPVIWSTSAVRLTESVARYTLNKTGLELLYMPLSRDLRNRIKAFIDIFFDRLSRAAGGILLIILTRVLDFDVRRIAFVVIGLTIPWVWIAYLARREYIATIRKRLVARRLDLENPRISVQDRETVRMLEETALTGGPRQALYALTVLAEAPGYDPEPLMLKLAPNPDRALRAKLYETARAVSSSALLGAAVEDARSAAVSPRAAAAYAVSMSPQARELAGEFLNEGSIPAAMGTLDALAARPELALELIQNDWIARHAGDPSPERRALAAHALGVRGDQGTEALYRLLNDPDAPVVEAACDAAGSLRNRAYVHALIERLSNARVRASVIQALARYGPQICGSLGDLLEDRNIPPNVRRQVPRVLGLIPDPRSVDVLLRAAGHPDLGIRGAVLKALNRLRESAPELKFDDACVAGHVCREARAYFELSAALAPVRRSLNGARAPALLVRTIEERLAQTLERVFRLLGLRYPPKEIYSTYLAVSRRRAEETAAAVEYLDTLLDRSLRRVLLPLLDAPELVPQRGRELFGVEFRDSEAALRELVRAGDPWLAACAMAAAGELRMRSLAPDIAAAPARSEPEVDEVARHVGAVLV